MVIPLIAGLGGAFTLIAKLNEHPVISYFVLLSVVLLDTGIGFALNYQGIAGLALSAIFNLFTTPYVFPIYSWELLILFALYPIVKMAWGKSKVVTT